MPDASTNSKASRLAAAQAFVQRIGRPDSEDLADLLADGVTYRVPGHQALAGTFTGRASVLQHLNDLVERTCGTIAGYKWEDWLIGDYHIGALAQVHAQTTGHLYQGRHLYLVRFNVDDRIDDVTVFIEDQDALARSL